MTNEELIEKVAQQMGYIDGVSPENYKSLAEAALSTILAALQEPTTAMYKNAHGHYEGEAFLPHGLWQAMLAASPLAPEGGKQYE